MLAPKNALQIAVLGAMLFGGFLTAKILMHPAGGWGIEDSWSEWAAITGVLAFVFFPFAWFYNALSQPHFRVVDWMSMGYAGSIVIFFGVGLIFYGHGTPVLMMVGVIVGWGFLLIAVVSKMLMK